MKVRIEFNLRKDQLHQLMESLGGAKNTKAVLQRYITGEIANYVDSVDPANPLKAFKVEVSE